MTDSISNKQDIIDSRDVIARIDELTDERDSIEGENDEDTQKLIAEWDETDGGELKSLLKLQEQAEGYSDWSHGVALIRDSYFEDYARETAEDLYGDKMRTAEWPFSCIDWEKAATELQQDYTSVDFDGVDYWVR